MYPSLPLLKGQKGQKGEPGLGGRRGALGFPGEKVAYMHSACTPNGRLLGQRVYLVRSRYSTNTSV